MSSSSPENDINDLDLNYLGFNSNRLSREDSELAFAKAWQAMNGVYLTQIITSPTGRGLSEISEREQTIVNTVIQWLGSQVGQAFLVFAISKLPKEARDYIFDGVQRELNDESNREQKDND